MKNKIKAAFLRTKGVIKTMTRFVPVMITAAGLATFTGLLIGGGLKYNEGYGKFKESSIYSEAYSQQYEEAQALYDNREMNLYEFNKKVEYLDSEKFTNTVLYEEAGPEAEPYRAMIKSGKAMMISSVSGVALTLAGPLLGFFVWLDGPGISEDLTFSASCDFSEAKRLLNKPPKKKNEEFEGELDEENLPNIEDSCYQE